MSRFLRAGTLPALCIVALLIGLTAPPQVQACGFTDLPNSISSGSGTLAGPAGTTFLLTIDYFSIDANESTFTVTPGGGIGYACTPSIGKATFYYTATAANEAYSYLQDRSANAGAGFSFSATSSPKNNGCPSSPANPGATCGNPINAATGNKFQVETDYVGGPNTNLELRRYYNSRGTLGQAPDFGEMWHSTYDRSVYSPAGALYAQVTRADGRIDQFSLQGNVWLADPDVTSTLTLLESGNTPTYWQVVTADDSTEIYALGGQLLSITTRAGLTTSLAYNADNQLTTVTGPFGHTLTFSYNPVGNVSQMVAPDGGVYAYGYDSKDNLISVTYPDSTVRQYVYGNTSFPNALTGIIDELSNRFATYTYDSSGRAISTQHAGGAELTTVTYNSNGTSSVTDARGNEYGYTFSTQFGVVKPTAVTGAPVQSSGGKAFTFDANGFVASRTDFNGNVTAYTHDSRGDETSRVEASGTALARTITTSWLSTFHLPAMITEPNRTTTFTYDAHGNMLTKAVTAAGVSRTWVYTYNTSGQVLTSTLRRTDLSDTTKYSYDSKSELATITDPLGHVTSITAYDANGRPLTIVDPNGLVTTLNYDARSRLTSRAVGAEVTSYTYDAAGNLTKVTLPDASFLAYAYDQAHRLTGVTDALGNSIAYTLDATDNRTLEQAFDPSNNLKRTRSYAYDLVNRLVQEIGAQAQTTVYTYDTQGNLTKVTDPLNHATTYGYDALNRLVSALDANNGTTAYSYNANDDLTSVTDPRGLNTAYVYDGLDDQSSLNSPDTGKTSRTFDPAGNVSVSTDARGDRTIYAHDALNRQTKATFADGKTIVWNYDQGTNGIGHLTTMTDATGASTWSYDQHGRVLQRQQQTGSVTLSTIYSYDAAGRLATITYPSGKQIAYSYDAAGRISGLSANGQPVVASATYLPFGIATGWTQSNGFAYSRTVDQDGRITGIGFGSTVIGLAYDDANRITGITETGQTSRTATYDALGRLTSYAVGAAATGYGYDADGNRLSSTTSTGTTNYTYPTGSNRLTALSGITSVTNVYDADGNLTSDGTNAYNYDARGRLVQATAAAITTEYGINGLGQRISKSGIGISSGSNEFIYDDASYLIGEYDALGNPIEETVWLGNTPVAVMKGAGSVPSLYAISADWLGTPHVISNSSGVPLWTWDHLAFGDNSPNQNPSGLGTFTYNLRFPGQYADAESGLSYNIARDYNASIGRYVESDPIGLAAGINTYIYAKSVPLSFFDRYGLSCSTDSPFLDFLLKFLPIYSTGDQPQGFNSDLLLYALLLPALGPEEVAIGSAGAQTLAAEGGAEAASASNAANGARLSEQLTNESAQSPFLPNGGLTQQAISDSSAIPNLGPGQLGNPGVPSGFGKYTTGTYQSPSGPFQVHFYLDSGTGDVIYYPDYKVVFNK